MVRKKSSKKLKNAVRQLIILATIVANSPDFINDVEKGLYNISVLDVDGTIKMIAPTPGMRDPEIIKLLKDNGVVVYAGHSNATFNQPVNGLKIYYRLETAFAAIDI